MDKARRVLLILNLLMVLVLMAAACAPAATPVAPKVEEPAAPVKTEAPAKPEAPVKAEEPVVTEAVAKECSGGLLPKIDFVFSSASHDPIRHEAGLLLSEAWQNLGMTVNEMPMDYSAYVDMLDTGKGYNAFIAGYVSRPERLDPDVFLYRAFHTKGDPYTGFNNPEYDALVEAQREEMDVNKRRELVFQAQDLLAEELPSISLYHVKEIHAYNKDQWDNAIPMLGQGLWNIWNVMSITPKTDLKTLKMGFVLKLDTINPYAETDGGAVDPERLVYDMLARVGPDGVPVPWAAESWEVVDNVTIKVNLRHDMAFHDGVPVTAEDVKFSYDTQKEQGASIYIPFLEPIKEVEIVDDYTLIFHLHKPYPALYQATFSQIFILPKHFWETIPDPKRDYVPDSMLGSGPFIFKEWLIGQEARYFANKDHWNAPKIDMFIQSFYDNPDSVVLAFLNQDIGVTDRRLLPAGVTQVKGVPYLELVELEDFGVYYLGFNCRIPPFDSTAFRNAVGYAVDYDTIVNVLLEGNAVPGKGFIAPSNVFWHNPDQLVREYDPEMAKELLAAAGYEWDSNGKLCFPPK